MKKIMMLFLVTVAVLSTDMHVSAAAPVSASNLRDNPGINTQRAMIRKIIAMSPRQFEKATGYSLSLKEKIGYRLLQFKLKKQLKYRGPGDDVETKADRTATLSMILGIAAYGVLFIPGIGVLAILMAIGAIVLGGVSVNKASRKGRAIAGIILGGLFLILLLIVLISFASIFN